MSSVRLASLEKRFSLARGPVVALDGLSLDVADGTCTAILGPSGCGKTTLLRVVAGLERPDAGSVFVGERDVTRDPPERRGVGMVFQNDALFPHLTVRHNVAYGLHGRGLTVAEVGARALDAARRMRVDDVLDRPARDLSGGQRQRVAVARALAPDPAILLLDEPFSRLDAPLRAELRIELSRALRETNATALFVTHDQSEAMALADTIAVMRAGRVEQTASPRVLYDAPANAYVATFVGSPAMSLVPAAAFGASALAQGAAMFGFRPEAMTTCAPGDGDIDGIVRAREDFGATAYVYVETPFGTLAIRSNQSAPKPGERCGVRCDRAVAHAFDAAGHRRPEPAHV